MKTELLVQNSIFRAAALLKAGEIVAFPTETVYGLGAPLFNREAIEKIFIAKGRPRDNPLIVHLAHIEQAEEIAINIPSSFYILAKAFWPGPLTLIVTKHPNVPSTVSAGLETIALRLPAHPIARSLIEEVGEPLVAPSANLSGKPSSTTAGHVMEDFEGKIAAVLDGGACQIGIESTVLDLREEKRPTLLRPGSITREEIEAVLGYEVALFSKETSTPCPSPGMRYRHYAPKATVLLFSHLEELLGHVQLKPYGKCLVLSKQKLEGAFDWMPLSTQMLYHSLRLSDAKGCSEILVLSDEEDVALMDRL